jgi:hypothetical protein
MHTLVARAAVMLVVDILPPLSETDLLSSTRMAANLTDALEDPQSPVGLQLTSSGATVAKVSAFANLGAVPPPGEDDSALDTSSQSFRLGLGIGGAVVVLLCCVLAVVLVRYWKHRRDTAKAAPPGTDAAAPAAAAAAVATGGDQCDARRGAPMRGKPARPDPAARANGMDRPFDGGVVHLHEHSEPVTVERRESYLRDAMRIDPEYVADPEYSLYRQDPRSSQIRCRTTCSTIITRGDTTRTRCWITICLRCPRRSSRRPWRPPRPLLLRAKTTPTRPWSSDSTIFTRSMRPRLTPRSSSPPCCRWRRLPLRSRP